MKKDPIIRMMSLFALVSVLGLIVLSVHNSLQSPYPLTVVRLEKVLGEQNTVKYENNSQSMKEYVKTGNSFSQTTGEKRAQSILDYRNQKGRISSMKELLEIDGIGEVLLIRLSEKFYAE